MYFYSNFVVLFPRQNMFKMFAHISGLDNIAFVNVWYWYLAIAIYGV